MVVAWRQRWRLDEGMRRWLWPERVGFVPRRLPAVPIAAPPASSENSFGSIEPLRSAEHSTPRCSRLGVVGGAVSTVAECARLLGVDVHTTSPVGLANLTRRATAEGWPVLATPASCLDEDDGALPKFLAAGGTLLVTGLDPSAGGALERLGAELGVPLPTSRWLSEPVQSGVRFAVDQRTLTRELTGIWFGSDEARAGLVGGDEGVLAWSDGKARRVPLAWARDLGGGRIVLTTGATELWDRTEAKWGRPLTMLVPLMVLRASYGAAAWHAPWRLANFTIDDPTLDRGRLGLDYGTVVRLAREHDFHLTVATIPRELGLADTGVLELLRSERERISACYHGNDHDSYEFYLEGAPRHRFRSQSLAVQRSKLTEAAARGSRLAARTGYALDRVMVFPHGLCSASLVPSLHERGFLATCNGLDRYPLGSPLPAGEDIGARPADLDWSGFPLFGRRPLGAVGELALDLFLGKAAIAFTHRPDVGASMTPLLDQAALLNGLASPVSWCGLEDVARHSYLVRSRGSHWDVLMTANEICLHNPDSTERIYRIYRPHLPAGDRVRARPATAAQHTAKARVDVAVPAGGMVEVDVRRPLGSGSLPPPQRSGCPLCP